ncbi:MAG: ATP synthase F0 subunit B [Candidatus Zixiibacteriota bacterium]|nr:MAG: ATP synthase F0 subunit B [candidate division Zixibacteria bacterium]
MDFELQQILTHALGFLIFVWVLKRFAWGPLLGLLEERREKIAGEFDEIDKQKAEVAQVTAEYEARMKEIEGERRAKMVEAVKEGKQMAADIKNEAMNEIRAMHEKAKADLQRDVAKAKVQLRDEMISITMTAAEKVVAEKMDDAKHRDLIGRYIDELERA